MPIGSHLDYNFFMKNRDKLVQLINFLKTNVEISDADLKNPVVKKRIAASLNLRNAYSAHGGFLTCKTSRVNIAGHRALAAFITW